MVSEKTNDRVHPRTGPSLIEARIGRASTKEAWRLLLDSHEALADLDPSTSCRPLPVPGGRGVLRAEGVDYDDRSH